jgi:hypothetical protein
MKDKFSVIKKEIQLIIDGLALNHIAQASILLIKVSEDLENMLDVAVDEAELVEISKYQVLLNYIHLKIKN